MTKKNLFEVSALNSDIEKKLSESEEKELLEEFNELDESMPNSEVAPHIEYLEENVATLQVELNTAKRNLRDIDQKIKANTDQLDFLEKSRASNEIKEEEATTALNALGAKNKNTKAYKEAYKRFIETGKEWEESNKAYENFNQDYEENQSILRVQQRDAQGTLQQAQRDLDKAQQELTSAQSPTIFSKLTSGFSNFMARNAADNMKTDEDLEMTSRSSSVSTEADELASTSDLSNASTQDLYEQNLSDDNSINSETSTVVESFKKPQRRRSSLEIVDDAITTAQRDLEAINLSINSNFEKDTLKLAQLEKNKAICETNLAQATEIFNSTSYFSISGEYTTARNNKNQAQLELEEAQNAINDTQMIARTRQEGLLTVRYDIEENLKILQEKREAVLLGQEIDISDDLSTYTSDTELMNFNASIKEEPILSRYAEEAPDIKDELTDINERKNQLENLYIEQEDIQAQLRDEQETINEINTDRRSLKEEIVKQQSLIAEKETWATAFDPKGGLSTLFYNIKRFMMNLVGLKTQKQNADDSVKFSKAVLSGMHTRNESTFKALDAEEKQSLSNVRALHEQEKACIALIGEDKSLDRVTTRIQELNRLASRDENKIKSDLLARCKVDTSMGMLRDKENIASVNVKNALREFIEYPTNYTLAKLERTRNQHPDYTTNNQLTKLLEDAREIYPKITSVTGSKLSINADKATQLLSDEINKNNLNITSLQTEQAKLSQQLPLNTMNFQQKSASIEQNKAALKKCHRLLYFAEGVKKHYEESKEENSAQGVKASNDTIAFLEQKIKRIEKNLPKNELNEFKDIKTKMLHRMGAIIDLESSREQISSILEENGIELPIEMPLNDDLLNNILKDIDQETRKQIWTDINQLPKIQEQADEQVIIGQMLIDAVDGTVMNLTTTRTNNIEGVLDSIDLITKTFNRAEQTPAQEQATDAFNLMIDRFQQKYEADPIQAITTFKQELGTLDPEIQVKFQDVFADVNEQIDKTIQSPTDFLEHSIFWEKNPLIIVEDPALKSVDLKALRQTCQQQETRVRHLEGEIEQLQSENHKLTQERDLVASGASLPTSMKEIDEMIKQCAVKPLGFTQDNPVRVQLKYFLNDPSQDRLNTLKSTMENNPHYTKNPKLLSLVKQAGEFYPDVTRAHLAIVNKDNPNQSLASCKQALDNYGQTIEQQADAIPSPDVQEQETQGLNIKH